MHVWKALGYWLLLAVGFGINPAFADRYTLPPMLTLQQVLTGGQQYAWLNARCVQWGDSLDPGQARGRNHWAMRCYQERSDEIFRIVGQSPERAMELTDETVRISAYMYLIRRIEEANPGLPGPKRYATFGMWDSANREPANPDRWKAPIDVNGSCGFPRPEFSLVAFCVEGCFGAGQTVRFGDDDLTLEQASSQNRRSVSTVMSGSTLEQFSWGLAPVSGYVETLGRSEQEVIRIEAEEDHALTVTPNHPILTSTGSLVEARSLRVGDLVVTDSGKLVAVVRLATEAYFGKVYNVMVDSREPVRHLVSAGGIVNGSSYFQNEGNDWLNRLLVRINLQIQ